jgi:hypothetical protein
MGKVTLLGCSGLMTDASAVQAPVGALRVADDVVIERPGVASQRPGFSLYVEKTTTRRPRSMAMWQGVPFVIATDGPTWSAEGASSTITGEAEPIDQLLSFPQFVSARDSFYWCTKKGPQKITGTADTAAAPAGMHEAPSGLPSVASSGTPVVLPTDAAAAWRWCFRKVDANGMILRSPPSPWQTMTNTSGATVDMSWTIPLPFYVGANDQIELYRTVYVTPSTAVPSDMMFLARTYLVTSADVLTGYVTLRDSTPETALGQELYTNPTREGFAKANARPPASVAMASWSECMWYGYVRGPWTCAFDVVTVSGTTSTDGLTGLQRLQCSADSTSGSDTLTNLASTTSIKVGQLCTDGGFPGASGGTVPIGATVLGKTATTVTLSANCTANEVGGSFYFHDGVTIDGVTYWAANVESEDANYPAFTVRTGNREVSTARSLAYVISRVSPNFYAFAIEDPYYANPRDAFERYTQATVVVRSRELDDPQWAVSFIADTTSDLPAIAFRANPSGGVLVDRDEFPNGIAYSKPAEPEAVPELNFILVGDENAPVLAFAPLRGALLVWKTDGVYRVTGSPPDGWRIDAVAPRTRAIRGECVTVVGEDAYAWTDVGVVLANEGGVQNISDGTIGRDINARVDLIFADNVTTGAWVAGHVRENLLLVAVPGSFDAYASDVYCLHLGTRAWTRWTMDTYCAAYDMSGADFLIAKEGGWELREMRRDWYLSQYQGCDRIFSALTWTTVGSALTITNANRGSWTPKVGDWVSGVVDATTCWRRVTVATDNGVDGFLLTLSEAFPNDTQTSRTAYESIVSKLQWQARGAVPTDTAKIRRMHVVMDYTAYAGNVGGTSARTVIGAATNVTPSITTQTAAEDRSARLAEIDIAPPRDIARAAYWMPYLETDDIGLDWRCLGVSLDIEPVSGRADR